MDATGHAGHGAGAQARAAVSEGGNVRDRVRELTIRALKERKLSEISGLAQEVLGGASEAVRGAIPEARRNVLRQVYEGLSDAVETVASAGAGAVRAARERTGELLGRDVPAAARRISQAEEQLLDGVSRFAHRVSGEAREELEDLVRRARRVGPKVRESVGHAAHAADGHLLELTGETARAGAVAARRAAGGLALAAGGLLEGLAEVIAPDVARPRARKKSAPSRKPTGTRKSKAARKAKPRAKKKSAKKTGKRRRS